MTRFPAKIILSGEHAVVYGAPALVTAVDRYAVAQGTLRPDGGLSVSVDGGPLHRWSLTEWAAVVAKVDAQYQDFVNGQRLVTDILQHDSELLAYAIAQGCPSGVLCPMHIDLGYDFPSGCGMGASAATALTLVAEAARLHQTVFTSQELYEKAMAVERLQHGHPSGVDPYTCLHGGVLRFQSGQAQELDLPALDLNLWNSGRPESSTGECVAHVRRFSGDTALWRAFAEVEQAMESALSAASFSRLRESMCENHRLLVRLGVVPECVQQRISEMEDQGGAAKICGAGTVAGEGAGMVWVLEPEEGFSGPCPDWMKLQTVRAPF